MTTTRALRMIADFAGIRQQLKTERRVGFVMIMAANPKGFCFGYPGETFG